MLTIYFLPLLKPPLFGSLTSLKHRFAHSMKREVDPMPYPGSSTESRVEKPKTLYTICTMVIVTLGQDSP